MGEGGREEEGAEREGGKGYTYEGGGEKKGEDERADECMAMCRM